ncbi:hypothetical protein DC31_15960 [Microbacterium sp. CH12i]|uniref:hypothetical protein n=1 Tax=Microbacterium sp. CH12i TaxID=1479651 RepID=UPI000460DDD0|nr:hypothetical protein [Microbacterium sp. CH12i]KDA05455.1 hypothetical protein DC31_15960 [Microbacterium sp. CH12i]
MHARRRAAALLVPLLLLTGCAGTSIATTSDAPAGDTQEIPAVPGYDPATKTIRVGSLVPVSGVFAAAITQVQGGEAYFARAPPPVDPSRDTTSRS